jgi:DNA-binding MarR family transcriptional regulator
MASVLVSSDGDERTRDYQRAASQLLRLRRERQRHFSIDATGPAWALMLALFEADRDRLLPSVGEIAKRADVPRTTAIRWLRKLEHHGYATSVADRRDRRLVRVRIANAGREAMQSLFEAAGLRIA